MSKEINLPLSNPQDNGYLSTARVAIREIIFEYYNLLLGSFSLTPVWLSGFKLAQMQSCSLDCSTWGKSHTHTVRDEELIRQGIAVMDLCQLGGEEWPTRDNGPLHDVDAGRYIIEEIKRGFYDHIPLIKEALLAAVNEGLQAYYDKTQTALRKYIPEFFIELSEKKFKVQGLNRDETSWLKTFAEHKSSAVDLGNIPKIDRPAFVVTGDRAIESINATADILLMYYELTQLAEIGKYFFAVDSGTFDSLKYVNCVNDNTDDNWSHLELDKSLLHQGSAFTTIIRVTRHFQTEQTYSSDFLKIVYQSLISGLFNHLPLAENVLRSFFAGDGDGFNNGVQKMYDEYILKYFHDFAASYQ